MPARQIASRSISADRNFVAGPSTFFYDTFTDVPGTALSAHTPDISFSPYGWIEEVGDWEIKAANDAGQHDGIEKSYFALVETEQSDVNIKVTIGVPSPSGFGFGITARFVNLSARINLIWLGNSNLLNLLVAGGSGGDSYAGHGTDLVAGDTLELRLRGTSITGYLNDVLRVSTESPSFVGSTRHGLYENNPSLGWTADDFLVERTIPVANRLPAIGRLAVED